MATEEEVVVEVVVEVEVEEVVVMVEVEEVAGAGFCSPLARLADRPLAPHFPYNLRREVTPPLPVDKLPIPSDPPRRRPSTATRWWTR